MRRRFKTAPGSIFGPNLVDFGTNFFDFSDPRSIKIWACIRIPFQGAFQVHFWTNLDQFWSTSRQIFGQILEPGELQNRSRYREVHAGMYFYVLGGRASCVRLLRVPPACVSCVYPSNYFSRLFFKICWKKVCSNRKQPERLIFPPGYFAQLLHKRHGWNQNTHTPMSKLF